MEFRDYLRVLRRHWRFIIALALIGAIAGTGAGLLQPKRFVATSRAYVSVSDAQTLSDQVTGITFAQQAAQGYAQIATSEYVLQPVIDRLGLHNTPAGLAKRLVVTVADQSPVIQVTVTDSSGRRAALTANAVIRQLSTAAISLTQDGTTASPAPSTSTSTSTSTTGASTSPVRLTAVDLAPLDASAAVGTSVPLTTVVGLIIGAVLAAALGLFRDLLDTRIRTRDDLERVTDSPVLGVTLRDPRAGRTPLVTLPGSTGPIAEAYRGIRTNLRFVQLDPARRSLVLTSSVEGEGKSVLASNLALAVAGVGSRVLLVDADLRRPRIGDIFGVDESLGLSDVLIGATALDAAVQSFGVSGVDLLPAGSVPPNPNELLQSAAMRELLGRLHHDYDLVLFDSPPLLAVSDAVLLGELAGAVVVVAASGRVKRPQLEAAMDSLQAVGARIAGVVLTMLPRSGPDGQQYGYGYGPVRAGHDTAETTPAPSVERVAEVESIPAPHVPEPAPVAADTGFLALGTSSADESEPVDGIEQLFARTGLLDAPAVGDLEVPAHPPLRHLSVVDYFAEMNEEPERIERRGTEVRDEQPAVVAPAEELVLIDGPLDEETPSEALAAVDAEALDEVRAGALAELLADEPTDVANAADEPSVPRRSGTPRFPWSPRRPVARSDEGAPVAEPVDPSASRAVRAGAKPVRVAPPPDLAKRLRRQSDSRSA